MSRKPFERTVNPPARAVVIGFRADAAERVALRKLARAEGAASVSEFVRRALLERIRRLHADAECAVGSEP